MWTRVTGCRWAGIISAVWTSLAAESLPPPGFRPVAPTTHALVGAQVVPQAGTTLTNATIVIRDGRIVAVGTNVAPPADARVWDLTGQIIYPGFIDPYLTLAATNRPVANRLRDTDQRAGANATASDGAAGAYRFFGVPGQERDAGGPGPGYAVATITPERQMADQYSPDPKQLEELRELGFTAGNIVPSKGIIRGQSAFVTLGDASPNDSIIRLNPSRGTAQHIAFEISGGEGVFPSSLMGAIAAVRQAFFDARWWSDSQAAFVTDPLHVRRAPLNAALQALQEPLRHQPVFFEPGSVLMNDRARRLAMELGLSPVILVACGEEWRRPDLIQPEMGAYIVPLAFPALPKFPSDDGWEGVSLDELRAWDWAPENPALLRRRQADVALTTFGLSDRKAFRKNLRTALDRGLSEADALAALTLTPARYCQLDPLLGSIEPGKFANLTICDSKGYFDPEGKVLAVWVDGRPYSQATPEKVAAAPTDAPKTDEAKAAQAKAESKKTELRALARKRVARDPLAGRGVLTNPPAVWIRNATIWTCADQGVLSNANLLVRHGKIEAVGDATKPATEVFEVDGTDLHVTPGLIDCHSHSMILGSVNEGTLPSTAMVRIGDVVNSETDNIHEQLAGGVTVANLLHGSANPIGGQNQVIKLRDGVAPEDLKFTNAPAGIKFALGENVKQSNWGERFTTRFPQTRMGVPTFFQNRFTAAQQYVAAEKAWRDGGERGVRPRRNLELEALAEIIAGTRLVHCHSYRQDEIVVFLRAMESFGVRVATLQHVLEGYKVADEIAQHGAGGSTFADWWTYKYEVIDAIPYAASLMRDRGVLVSINSDSDDHARRLNFEAAKAVKYGGTPETEALKFVTLNPAKQLHIDRWVGSLEPGKDADFVIWSGHPLDSSSVCLQTWIEGKQYFDRAFEPVRSTALEAERNALL
ncbi:MAG TPA: amidohydrolase family protein, partial [Verrucomicrobiota bacterium]|nr:hypothetical protein [Verrucomicrobiales bacterium]HRI13461.1 amidohydrolase family protein [Verrucomicrobiota bacterium]